MKDRICSLCSKEQTNDYLIEGDARGLRQVWCCKCEIPLSFYFCLGDSYACVECHSEYRNENISG